MISRTVLTVGLTALALTGMGMPASAQRVTDTVVGSCVFGGGAVNCVRQYRYGDAGNSGIQSLREPDPRDLAEARDREARWVARCQPRVRQDSYGVGRYVYAARGCEFGRDVD